MEYSDAEAYSHGYGGTCVACGGTQSSHSACLTCGGPVWPDHTDWDYVCGELRSREELVQIGVALASRGLSIELCVRVLVDGGLDGLMEEVVRVGLVAIETHERPDGKATPVECTRCAAGDAGSGGKTIKNTENPRNMHERTQSAITIAETHKSLCRTLTRMYMFGLN